VFGRQIESEADAGKLEAFEKAGKLKRIPFADRAQIHDGYVHLNDKPGFGIEIDWRFVDAHRLS